MMPDLKENTTQAMGGILEAQSAKRSIGIRGKNLLPSTSIYR